MRARGDCVLRETQEERSPTTRAVGSRGAPEFPSRTSFSPTFTMRTRIHAALLVTIVLSATTALASATRTRSCPTTLRSCLDELSSGGSCSPVLPIPTKALPPRVRPVGFNLTPVRQHVHLYHDGMYMALLLTDQNRSRVAVVDVPDSIGSSTAGWVPAHYAPVGTGTRLSAALEELLDGAHPSQVVIIYSHAHMDHIGGAAALGSHLAAAHPKASVHVYGSPRTAALVASSTTNRTLLVTHVVGPRGAKLDLGANGAGTVRLLPTGGHTADDLAILLPRRGNEPGILHHVDVVFPGWAPFRNLALARDLRDYVAVHHRLLDLDWDILSAGHLTRLGSREDVVTSLAFVTDLLTAAADGVAAVGPRQMASAGLGRLTDPSADEFGNIWWGFLDVGRRLPTDRCVRTMLDRWGCRLAGVDVTIRENCFSAVTHEYLER